jgi:riboflavin kinase/FMN adenylyltransferase
MSPDLDEDANLPQKSDMRIHRTWADLPAAARGGIVALGNFDGVHLGHAHLLRAARAARPDLPLSLLTFEPHPRELFRPEDPPFRLTLAPERAALLAGLGVAELFQLPFDTAFSTQPAEAFVQDILHAGLGARHLVCGPDFAFGHRRGGDVAFLAARAEALGIGIMVVPPLADEQGPISSTRIRRLLQDGYPERASALLGRPWAISGIVTHGDQRGRTLGFPTANVPLGRHLEPARGVYAVRVATEDGGEHPGVANIGRRPTVNSTLESRLEVHLFDFAGDLYDADISVSLMAFLRAEKRFDGIDALRAQIALDATHARELLDRAAAPSA